MRYQEDVERIRSRLSEKRFVHSLNVAVEAERLSLRYGADPEKAYRCGLLHDIMKDDPPEAQRAYIRRSGIVLTAEEESSHKLWHSIAGAAYMERELGITDPQMLRAVRYHTSARAGMELLEKIVYLADFTSADRDYNGVERMRQKVDRSLEEAMEEGLSFTVCELAGKGAVICRDTFEAYNEIMLGKRAEQTPTPEKEG